METEKNKVYVKIEDMNEGEKSAETLLQLFSTLILYYRDHNLEQGKIFTAIIYNYFKALIDYTDQIEKGYFEGKEE